MRVSNYPIDQYVPIKCCGFTQELPKVYIKWHMGVAEWYQWFTYALNCQFHYQSEFPVYVTSLAKPLGSPAATFFSLKGRYVSMKAMESQWFHWQWNNNKTKGSRGFTVHTVDSTHHMHSTWKTTKVYRRMEQQNKRISILTKHFKQRKLWVDQSKSIWYAVEQYGERTERNIGTHIDNGPPAVMHS